MVADECKLQEEPNPFYRWHRRGVTPILKVRRREDISFFGGLSLTTGSQLVHLCHKQNSKEAIKFLKLIKAQYQPLTAHTDRRVLILWDNASWHKSKEIRQWLRENNTNPQTEELEVMELMNFPPYCPDLNPQEHVWKALRNHLSQIAHRFSFDQTINRACLFLNTSKFHYQLLT